MLPCVMGLRTSSKWGPTEWKPLIPLLKRGKLPCSVIKFVPVCSLIHTQCIYIYLDIYVRVELTLLFWKRSSATKTHTFAADIVLSIRYVNGLSHRIQGKHKQRTLGCCSVVVDIYMYVYICMYIYVYMGVVETSWSWWCCCCTVNFNRLITFNKSDSMTLCLFPILSYARIF